MPPLRSCQSRRFLLNPAFHPLTALKTFTLLLFATAALGSLMPRAEAQSAAAYTIVDAATGHVFDSANADAKLQVASLTKIATAMVVLDWAERTGADLGQRVTIPPGALALGGPNAVGWQPGDSAMMRELLYATLLQSDNIAAHALAEHVGRMLPGKADAPPMTRFVAQMNALARTLGMRNTSFLNPHGLDSLEKKLPFSTAADMARLSRHAMASPGFRFFVSQKERRVSLQRASGEKSAYLLRNTNELVGVNAIDGIKTGTSQRAGECLAISAARPPESRQVGEAVQITPRRLIVVVLGAANRFDVAAGLLARGWQMHEQWTAAGRPAPAPR